MSERAKDFVLVLLFCAVIVAFVLLWHQYDVPAGPVGVRPGRH